MERVANAAFPVKANGIAVCFGQQPVKITTIRISHLSSNNFDFVHGCARGSDNL